MAKSVTGGRGVQGMNWSGKENRLDMQSTQTVAGGKTNREKSGWGSGMLAQTPPGTTSRSLSSKFSTAYTPGDYSAYRRTLTGYVAAMKGKKPTAPAAVAAKKPVVAPAAQVIRTTVNERTTPPRAATPANKPINARTGNTTGISTGKTTGTTSRTPGMATKTYQSAYGRQMSNAMNRTNQPGGPMGRASGGGGGGGGSRSSGGSLSGGGSGGRQAGTSRTGGTRGNEPAGPKRG